MKLEENKPSDRRHWTDQPENSANYGAFPTQDAQRYCKDENSA